MLNIFLGVLTAILASLKIAGVITTSWWLILLPIYGPALVVAVLLFAGAAYLKN